MWFSPQALLDSDVKDKTRTVVDCETKDWQNNVVAFPVASLTLGVSEMVREVTASRLVTGGTGRIGATRRR